MPGVMGKKFVCLARGAELRCKQFFDVEQVAPPAGVTGGVLCEEPGG